MNKVLKGEVRLWHPATEPVSAGEVYSYLTGEKFDNELEGTPADYDCRTIYGELLGGDKRYICDKETVLSDIKRFILSQ